MLLLSLVVSSQNPFFVVVVAWAVCFCFAFCLFVCVLAVEMPLCPLLCLVVFLFFLCQCVLLCCSSVFPLCLLLPVSLDCWGLILCFCCVAHATAAAWCWAGVFPFLSFFFSSFFPFLLPCFLFLFLCHPSIQASITSRCCCIFSGFLCVGVSNGSRVFFVPLRPTCTSQMLVAALPIFVHSAFFVTPCALSRSENTPKICNGTFPEGTTGFVRDLLAVSGVCFRNTRDCEPH